MPVGEAWRGALLAERFDALDTLLARQWQWWRPRAFQQLRLPWETEHAGLAGALRALSADRIAELAAQDSALVEFLGPFIPEIKILAELCAVPASPRHAAPLSLAEPYGVPGRKWRQTLEFLRCLPDSGLPVLEWCAGKAHLGRALAAQQGRSVEALEWNATLVEDGNRLARREHLPVTVHCVDVLQNEAAAWIGHAQEVVALHACGDLHRQLLMQCARRTPRALALVPCCYHLGAAECHVPLSRAAMGRLTLTRDDLRTAVQETVTAPARDRAQRQKLQAWRLGFDLLQRELRGVDEYLPTPSLALSVLREGFESFCRKLAAQQDIALPANMDFDVFEQRGAQRAHEVAALDLVRVSFRRPLELWLVLDRALYLQEHGYDVEVGTFCERPLTPRNLLIRARRFYA